MTQASTRARARARDVPRPDLWSIGRYQAVSGPIDYPVNHEDLERDTRWAADLLAAHGARRGTTTLLVSAGWEAPWFGPIMGAVKALGGTYCFSELWGWDAPRTEMFVRRLQCDLVIGINRQVAEGMAAVCDLGATLGAVPAILARSDAVDYLRGHGLAPGLFDLVGPATVLECPAHHGAHYCTDEWRLSGDDGQVAVTTVGPRAHQVVSQPLPFVARLDDEPCSCGRYGHLFLDGPSGTPLPGRAHT